MSGYEVQGNMLCSKNESQGNNFTVHRAIFAYGNRSGLILLSFFSGEGCLKIKFI